MKTMKKIDIKWTYPLLKCFILFLSIEALIQTLRIEIFKFIPDIVKSLMVICLTIYTVYFIIKYGIKEDLF